MIYIVRSNSDFQVITTSGDYLYLHVELSNHLRKLHSTQLTIPFDNHLPWIPYVADNFLNLSWNAWFGKYPFPILDFVSHSWES